MGYMLCFVLAALATFCIRQRVCSCVELQSLIMVTDAPQGICISDERSSNTFEIFAWMLRASLCLALLVMVRWHYKLNKARSCTDKSCPAKNKRNAVSQCESQPAAKRHRGSNAPKIVCRASDASASRERASDASIATSVDRSSLDSKLSVESDAPPRTRIRRGVTPCAASGFEATTRSRAIPPRFRYTKSLNYRTQELGFPDSEELRDSLTRNDGKVGNVLGGMGVCASPLFFFMQMIRVVSTPIPPWQWLAIPYDVSKSFFRCDFTRSS